MSEVLQQKQPCEIEGRNFRRAYRERQSGKLYLVQFEVTKELWDLLESIPSEALIGGVLWHHDGDGDDPAPVVAEKPKRAKKEKPVKGEYGLYWQEMHKRGYCFFPALQEELGFPPGHSGNSEEIKAQIKKRFDVTSLTFISPDDFEEWLSLEDELIPMIQLSRECAAKVGL